MINQQKSHDDVIAKKIGFTTDNAPSYDWDRRYSVDFPLSGKESTEDQSIRDYYSLDEVYYNDASAYFKGRLTLYVGNVTGAGTQMWDHHDTQLPSKASFVLGKSPRDLELNKQPHVTLDGMSILFGGESAKDSSIRPNIPVHQPPHYDGSYKSTAISFLQKNALMEPWNIMFTLNEGETRWIYVMDDSNASPVKIPIKHVSCLLFSNFKVHGGMVFNSFHVKSILCVS